MVATPPRPTALPVSAARASRARCSTGEDRQQGVYLGLLEAEPGAEVPRHSHAGRGGDPVTCCPGGGELTVGSEKIPFGADQAIHIPEDQPHAAKFTGPDKTVMVQIYAPAGPEQRFRAGRRRPPKPPAAPRRQERPSHDHFELTDDQRILQNSVRELCERLIVPNARRGTRRSASRTRSIPALAEMGLLGMQIPEEYGGAGMKFHDYVIALEEVARADGSVGLTMASHNSLCTGHIYLAGNEAQKQKYLPRLATRRGAGRLGAHRAGLGLRRGRGAHARRAQGRRLGRSTAPRPSSPRARWARSTSCSPRPAPRRRPRG